MIGAAACAADGCADGGRLGAGGAERGRGCAVDEGGSEGASTDDAAGARAVAPPGSRESPHPSLPLAPRRKAAVVGAGAVLGGGAWLDVTGGGSSTSAGAGAGGGGGGGGGSGGGAGGGGGACDVSGVCSDAFRGGSGSCASAASVAAAPLLSASPFAQRQAAGAPPSSGTVGLGTAVRVAAPLRRFVTACRSFDTKYTAPSRGEKDRGESGVCVVAASWNLALLGLARGEGGRGVECVGGDTHVLIIGTVCDEPYDDMAHLGLRCIVPAMAGC